MSPYFKWTWKSYNFIQDIMEGKNLNKKEQNPWALLSIKQCMATTYSHRTKGPTTIGAKKLNCCVRHGNRCILLATITTHCLYISNLLDHSKLNINCVFSYLSTWIGSWLSPRPISTRPLRTLLHFHFEPIYLIVFQGSYSLAWCEILSWSWLRA